MTVKTPSPKPIEVFCGTGGVGKTTLAASRAFHLAGTGKKVLLITIDPAKRLKQILGLSEVDSGVVQTIELESSSTDSNGKNISYKFDTLLMSPYATMKRVIWKKGLDEEITIPGSDILKIIFRPNGGMNEIMSVVEVQHQLDKKGYDTIILDTPPGQHFIDFLESAQKIEDFFDKNYIDLFKYLGKRVASASGKGEDNTMLNLLVSSGVKKLLNYLEKVTGPKFVDQFIDAVHAIYQGREEFVRALEFKQLLKKPEKSNWFWVTAIDHQKMQETLEIQKSATNFMHQDKYLCINKSLPDSFISWQPTDLAPQYQELQAVKNVMKDQQEEIYSFADKYSLLTVSFPEIFELRPEGQVSALAGKWG